MFTDIVWRFLILETFVMGALCCDSCAREHPQKNFCISEFVLKVDIKEEIKSPWEKSFRMEIKHVFKGDVRQLKLIQKKYVILKMPKICSIDYMKPGNKYIIFGKNDKGRIYTNMCSGNMPWRMTTAFYKLALAGIYKKNCNCVPEANYVTSSETRECQWKYSFMRRRGNKCKWVDSRYFRRCKKIHPGYYNFITPTMPDQN